MNERTVDVTLKLRVPIKKKDDYDLCTTQQYKHILAKAAKKAMKEMVYEEIAPCIRYHETVY